MEESNRFIISISGISLLLSLLLFLHYTFTKITPEPIKKNQIIYMISTPCSAMTQFLRMIAQRKDFMAMHIPANFAYCYQHNDLDLVKGWYKEDAPTTYEKAYQTIQKEALKQPLFIAETSHTATEFLTANPTFITNNPVQFLILLGNVHNLTISYYEKKKEYFDKLSADQISNSIGLKALYECLLHLKKQNKNIVICYTPDLFSKTETTVKTICQKLEIPYKPESLQWQNLDTNFTALPFWTIETASCSRTWQQDVITSNGFTKPEQYAVDKQGNPTFEEIKNKKHREICNKAYQENKLYFDLIMQINKA